MSEITCGKNVNSPCPHPAKEVLIARSSGRQTWEAYWRCEEHPASDDVQMIAQFDPDALTVILHPAHAALLSAVKAAQA